jgi:hypothetical protein
VDTVFAIDVGCGSGVGPDWPTEVVAGTPGSPSVCVLPPDSPVELDCETGVVVDPLKGEVPGPSVTSPVCELARSGVAEFEYGNSVLVDGAGAGGTWICPFDICMTGRKSGKIALVVAVDPLGNTVPTLLAAPQARENTPPGSTTNVFVWAIGMSLEVSVRAVTTVLVSCMVDRSVKRPNE